MMMRAACICEKDLRITKGFIWPSTALAGVTEKGLEMASHMR